MKINLTGYSEQTKIDLDELLGDDISATKEESVSATDICSDTTACSSTTSCSDTTESQRVNKWRQETKDTIRFDVKKGTKSFLLNEASKRGISLTQMIKDALKLYLSTN